MPKYIFVTRRVVSSLGKGITASSIWPGCLKSRGLRVAHQKFDPYLNVDPGTMTPISIGEVYVTDDGAETDLDLGHYERFHRIHHLAQFELYGRTDLRYPHQKRTPAVISWAAPSRWSRT